MNVVIFNNITSLLIYVLRYIHNKYPKCHNSRAFHELTPRSVGQWLTQKP